MTPVASGRRRRGLGLLVWAALLAAAVALPLGDSRRIPVEVWFAGFAFWLVVMVGVELLRTAPRSTISRLGLEPWLPGQWRPTPKRPGPRPLNQQRFLQALLQRAVNSERAYDKRLRPRLRGLAEHHLAPGGPAGRGERGAADTLDDQRLMSALGDTAWLLDDRVTDRRPTLDDIERFLDRLEAAP